MNHDYDDWYAEAIEQQKLSLSCLGAMTIFIIFCLVAGFGALVYNLI